MPKISLWITLFVISAVFVAGCGAPADYDGSKPFTPVPKLKSEAYYNKDGSFDQVKAKNAYYAMMRSYHYPISDMLKSDEFWVADFMEGDYAKLGMAGIFWKNVIGKYGDVGDKAYKGEFKDKDYGYLGHEIFLLPGQMLPEHRHIGGGKGFGPKMETWHIRHGSVDFFGEYKGAVGETLISEMPESERPWGYGEKWFMSKYVIRYTAGQIYSLNDPESWHFMRAGPKGAIVAEYATYHNHVELSKPDMMFGNSNAAKITKIKK